jgi:hypothetical protein
VKRDIVLVGGKEEKHTDGDYFLYHAGQWIPATPSSTSASQAGRCPSSGTRGRKRSQQAATEKRSRAKSTPTSTT